MKEKFYLTHKGPVSLSHLWTDKNGNELYEVYDNMDQYICSIEVSINESITDELVARKVKEAFNN